MVWFLAIACRTRSIACAQVTAIVVVYIGGTKLPRLKLRPRMPRGAVLRWPKVFGIPANAFI